LRQLNAAGISPRLVHLSASIPIAYGRQAAWQDMVRPGHAIYGYVSPARGHAPPKMLDVKPALTWRATVLSVKEVPPGEFIGYGGMFRTAERTRVATLAAGYADGIPHKLSNKGSVIVHGQMAPILGAVSMDMTTVNVTHVPQTRAGDAVTLLGIEGNVRIDAQEIAKIAGTISYSVLCGIHARVKRIYV
jgi:alanine racemase